MIRFLLLAGIDWTDRHQALMVIGAVVCLVLAGVVKEWLL